jgi:hypothetical protein
MEFADGSLIFLAFLIVAFFGVVIGYFTRAGSGINPRAYGKVYSGAPGAKGPGEVSGRDPHTRPLREWSRGAR